MVRLIDCRHTHYSFRTGHIALRVNLRYCISIIYYCQLLLYGQIPLPQIERFEWMHGRKKEAVISFCRILVGRYLKTHDCSGCCSVNCRRYCRRNRSVTVALPQHSKIALESSKVVIFRGAPWLFIWQAVSIQGKYTVRLICRLM